MTDETSEGAKKSNVRKGCQIGPGRTAGDQTLKEIERPTINQERLKMIRRFFVKIPSLVVIALSGLKYGDTMELADTWQAKSMLIGLAQAAYGKNLVL